MYLSHHELKSDFIVIVINVVVEVRLPPVFGRVFV